MIPIIKLYLCRAFLGWDELESRDFWVENKEEMDEFHHYRVLEEKEFCKPDVSGEGIVITVDGLPFLLVNGEQHKLEAVYGN